MFNEIVLRYLFFRIISQRGAQREDHLDPFLFSIIIQPFISSLSSNLNDLYLRQ